VAAARCCFSERLCAPAPPHLAEVGVRVGLGRAGGQQDASRGFLGARRRGRGGGGCKALRLRPRPQPRLPVRPHTALAGVCAAGSTRRRPRAAKPPAGASRRAATSARPAAAAPRPESARTCSSTSGLISRRSCSGCICGGGRGGGAAGVGAVVGARRGECRHGGAPLRPMAPRWRASRGACCLLSAPAAGRECRGGGAAAAAAPAARSACGARRRGAARSPEQPAPSTGPGTPARPSPTAPAAVAGPHCLRAWGAGRGRGTVGPQPRRQQGPAPRAGRLPIASAHLRGGCCWRRRPRGGSPATTACCRPFWSPRGRRVSVWRSGAPRDVGLEAAGARGMGAAARRGRGKRARSPPRPLRRPPPAASRGRPPTDWSVRSGLPAGSHAPRARPEVSSPQGSAYTLVYRARRHERTAAAAMKCMRAEGMAGRGPRGGRRGRRSL
jgi:hypothetical protein